MYLTFTISSVENLVDVLMLRNTEEKMLIFMAWTQIMEVNQSNLLDLIDPEMFLHVTAPMNVPYVEFFIDNFYTIINFLSVLYQYVRVVGSLKLTNRFSKYGLLEIALLMIFRFQNSI